MDRLTLRQDGDRSLQTRIPVLDAESTHVILSVSYSAGRGYTFAAVPVTVTDAGGSFRCMLMDHQFMKAEHATRYSSKRLKELGTLMVAQVEAGSGTAFDLLGKVLTKHGLERR